MTAAELAERLDAKRRGDWYDTICPAHDDDTPSSSFTDGDRGIVFKCHRGCTSGAIAEAMARKLGIRVADFFHANGLRSPKRTIAATYDYTDESAQLLYQAVRFDPKEFKQRRPDGQGGWVLAWPMDFDTYWWGWCRQHLLSTVLRPVPGPAVDLAQGAWLIREEQPH